MDRFGPTGKVSENKLHLSRRLPFHSAFDLHFSRRLSEMKCSLEHEFRNCSGKYRYSKHETVEVPLNKILPVVVWKLWRKHCKTWYFVRFLGIYLLIFSTGCRGIDPSRACSGYWWMFTGGNLNWGAFLHEFGQRHKVVINILFGGRRINLNSTEPDYKRETKHNEGNHRSIGYAFCFTVRVRLKLLILNTFRQSLSPALSWQWARFSWSVT